MCIGDRGEGANPGMRVAGVRTFPLLGVAAGLAGVIAGHGFAVASGLVFAAATAIVAIGYSRAVLDSGKPDATSAVAAMVTLGLGFLAGIGEEALAVAGAAVVTLILALRTEGHRWVGALDEAGLQAFTRYAAAAYTHLPSPRVS